MARLPAIALAYVLCDIAAGGEQPPAAWLEAVNTIGPSALRAQVSFLASDALEGRGTPSRGLDIAAEYIAAQFRRAGLEPAEDDGYFLTAIVTPQMVDPKGKEDPGWKEAKVRNVISLLRGSDAALKDTYVLLSAHYDHEGMLPPGEGDRIYNGANDNASGVAVLLQVAEALGGMKERPRRIIVFLALWGEEEGLLGARHYVRHPAFPLDKTIANLTLEVMGQPDPAGNGALAKAPLTGFDYSDVGPSLAAAARRAGVEVYKHEPFSDDYFNRSDNLAFAEAGIPSHTLTSAYGYAEYHRVDDNWDKLDYDNMAKLARGVALGLLHLANSPQAPRWNEANARADRYRKVRQESAAGLPSPP